MHVSAIRYMYPPPYYPIPTYFNPIFRLDPDYFNYYKFYDGKFIMQLENMVNFILYP